MWLQQQMNQAILQCRAMALIVVWEVQGGQRRRCFTRRFLQPWSSLLQPLSLEIFSALLEEALANLIQCWPQSCCRWEVGSETLRGPFWPRSLQTHTEYQDSHTTLALLSLNCHQQLAVNILLCFPLPGYNPVCVNEETSGTKVIFRSVSTMIHSIVGYHVQFKTR